MEERPQKRDLIFRSSLSSIETSTPRLQPDQRRQPSFSSPTYSPPVSPSYSDHSTSRGFYSPRGGEDDDEVDEDDASDGVDCNDVHEDERGYLYRPRSLATAVEMPVRSTVSRSVRVEPMVETRVDSGVKERELVERRAVEEEDGGFNGLEFRGGDGGGRASVRRKWDGMNTVVYDSGLKGKEGMRVVEEESSVEFGGRKVFEFGAKEKEVLEEESGELGRRRGGKSNAVVSDSGVKEENEENEVALSDSGVKEENEVARERRVVEKGNVELGNRGGRKSNAFVSESGVKVKEEKQVVRGQRVAEEGNVEFRDGRGQMSYAFVSDSGVKEKEVARGQRVLNEGAVGFRDGRLQARNAMVLDSSPKLVYDSRPKEEVEGTKTVVYEAGRKDEGEDRARVMEEGGGGGGEGVEGAKPSFRRTREGRKSEVLFMRKAALWLRVVGLVMCVISFSIMAVNKNKGWALDSYDQYQEFRYCMSVSILGFVYSIVQALDVAYHLSTDKYSNRHGQLRYYLDFFMDQVLSYFLISASSSAATRVEDWVSNWGKDKFPQMASVSVIISFIAFGSFAFSSLVSGYILCSVNVS